MLEADFLKLECGKLIYTSYYEAYAYIDFTCRSKQVIAEPWDTRNNLDNKILVIDPNDIFIINPKQTYPLTEYQFKRMRRYFNGNAPKPETVRTVNTGGHVMNDLYDTDVGLLIVVYEHGCAIYINEEAYHTGWNYLAQYNWDEPLMSINELTEDEDEWLS
jgi:hypothetical protein